MARNGNAVLPSVEQITRLFTARVATSVDLPPLPVIEDRVSLAVSVSAPEKDLPKLRRELIGVLTRSSVSGRTTAPRDEQFDLLITGSSREVDAAKGRVERLARTHEGETELISRAPFATTPGFLS